jgi:hypothetical protein
LTYALRRRLLPALTMLVVLSALFGASRAAAGPPYVTDDPEPTDYRHWEIYTGFQYANDRGSGVSVSLPFAEFNYGAMPNVQVSLTMALDDNISNVTHRYDNGDTEIAVKTRFVQESQDRPQISFYPSVEIPSVAGAHAVTYLPLWLQKSSGPWTAFGGGGLYLNAGPRMRDYAFVGGALERALSPGTTIGAELFHQGAEAIGASDTTAANVGMIAQVGKYHAILISFGRALHGDDAFSAYASYEFALGPAAGRK